MNTERISANNKTYYDQIDALKGIAIFLVVLGHSIVIYPINLYQNKVCAFIFDWLSSVHMPMFFMISGFCNSSYKDNYYGYIWKKIRRILIPYLIFNAIDMVLRFLFPGLVNRPRGIGESIKRIIFFGGEYWFLYTLFIIFLLYPIINKCVKNSKERLIGTIILVLILWGVMSSITIFTLNYVIYYIFYFLVGILLKEIFGNKLFEVKFNKVLLTFTSIGLFTMWILLLMLKVSYLKIVIALLGILAFYFCVQYSTVVNVFKRFGQYSLQLYLFNGYLLVISRTLIISIIGVTNPFTIICFNMLVDFIVSFLVIKYVCTKIKIVKVFMGMIY